MAVVSRVARLRLDDVTTHALNFHQWVATAAVQDTPAGLSVVITTVFSGGGSGAGNPETLTLNLYTDAGSLIRAFPLDTSAVAPPQISSFYFTADGTSNGAPRAGTVEIALRATRASNVAYDVETDGTPNNPPTGFDSHLDRGWIRGTTTAITSLSNVGPGGAKPSPAEYDESLFARTTLGADLYRARALTVAISGATPALSAATNSATTGNFDATMSNVVDDRFSAAVTTVSTSLSVPNATLTGQPATVLTATNDSMTVDPRLTATHHFQVDDNVFARAKDVPAREMLSTQTGFLATRFVSARTASGINGLTVAQTLTPVNPGVAVGPTSSTTATRDSEAGWTDLLAWPSSKPGGTWNKTVDVTAPTDIDPDAYVLAGTQTYTMLAPDPSKKLVLTTGHVTATHWRAGLPLRLVIGVFDSSLVAMVDPDPGSLIFHLIRSTGLRFEFLRPSDFTWQPFTGPEDTGFVPTQSPEDPHCFHYQFSAAETAAWNGRDLTVIGRLKVGGTPYAERLLVASISGANNPHDGYAVDPIGLAVSGVLSTR